MAAKGAGGAPAAQQFVHAMHMTTMRVRVGDPWPCGSRRKTHGTRHLFFTISWDLATKFEWLQGPLPRLRPCC